MVDEVKNNEPRVKVTYGDGTVEYYSVDEASAKGIKNIDPEKGSEFFSYTDDMGKKAFSTNSYDVPASMTLNTETGNIEIHVPKEVSDIPEFKQIFNEDVLKQYSQAYKLNPDYKVIITEYDDDGKEKGQKEVTIPEWVEDRNEALQKFMKQLTSIEDIRNSYRKDYGDKVDKLSLTQIIMSKEYGDYTYVPEILKHVGTFGDNRVTNPITKILDKIQDDGRVSTEDLKDFYNRDYFGRTELAGLLAVIDGALQTDWGETYYEGDDGKMHYNEASAEEAAKLLAFRNFVLSHHPEGNWFQEIGSSIETLSLSALYASVRVFYNAANDAEWLVTFGNGKHFQNRIKEMDSAMSNYVETKSLESEATSTLYTLGMIGGTIGGTVLLSKAGGSIAKGIGTDIAKGIANASGAFENAFMFEKLGGSMNLLNVLQASDNISRGTILAVQMASAAEKAAIATSIYAKFKAALENHKVINYAVEYLMDTFHDALLYDSTTLRDALESTDAEVRNFWLGQLADNAKWWAGMAGAKMGFKLAGKTTLGKAANVVATRFINKVAVKVGNAKAKFKDRVHGGDIVETLTKKLNEAESHNEFTKARRYANKIEIENFNKSIRDAREQLSKIKLDWDGIKLTDDSLKKYQNTVTRIKSLEVGFDRYRNSVEYKRQEMIGPIKDPATGQMTYINKFLAEANIVASNEYAGLMALAKKYNLVVADKSLISQEMIDYWVSSVYEKRALAFAENQTDLGARAKNALPIIQENMATAKANLPEEIVSEIDKIVASKSYQAFYLELNEYGMAKGVFNRNRIQGYYDNPTWAEIGYMPIVVETGGRKVRIIDPEGLTEAKIAADMEKMEFNVEKGQHYQDPELVRNKHISDVAQMELNRQLFKAYSGNGSDATNITKISGEETEYVRILKENRKAVDVAVTDSAKAIGEKFKSSNFEFEKVRRRKPIKNTTVPESDRVTIVNSMDPETVNRYLATSKRGKGKNANNAKRYIAEGETTIVKSVNADNYAAWYKEQSKPVKKFLLQQKNNYYDDYSVDANGVKVKTVKIDGEDTNIDYEIADRVSAMNADGYTSYNSHSGISSDHEKAAGDGYIQFSGNLDQAKLDKIKNSASKAGMSYWEEANLAYGNTLTVTQSPAADGTTFADIMQEANQKVYKKLKVPSEYKGSDKWGWILDNKKLDEAWDIREKEVEKLYKKHGGHAISDDAARTKSWDKFFDELGYENARTTGPDFDQFKFMAEEGGQDFENALERATLVGDKEFARGPLANEARHNLDKGKEAFYQGVLVAEVKGKLRNVKKIDTTKMVDEMIPEIKDLIDGYVTMVLDDVAVQKSVAVLAETSNASEDFARYIALRQLMDKGLDDAAESFAKTIDAELKKLKDIAGEDIDAIKEQAKKLFKDSVETELDDVTQSVRTTNPDLVDAEDIYNKATALDQEIREIEPEKGSDSNVVTYLDDQGRQVFAEVDPAFASLYNFRFNIEKGEASAMAKFNAMTSRWFRYGTTSVNFKAFGNQLFRDFGNALLIGGSWHTIKYYRQNLVDVFGKNIVDQIGRFDPTGYEMKQVEALAEATGQTVEEAAVSRELMRGMANAPSSTERTLYKKFMSEAFADSNSKLANMKQKIRGFIKDHTGKDADVFSPEHLLNDKRENYLRNRVFAHSFNEALEEGYDLQQARVFADFAMDNATTNFGRQIYHMQAIADSTPYFRAAINGSKSFWRMWSLDPIGISGRITCGLVIPVMYLVGASLGSEENRKVYENIPEYQKQDSLVFVVRGGIVSLPMPQELSAFVAPYRQFVEYLYNSNKNDFWELMMNDALGFFPYDLQGFSTIDMDQMIQDPTIFDRMSRGFSRLFSQMAPIPLKTAYMAFSGIDPYTGKSLRNPEYVYWNDETGDFETPDFQQNEFAKWFAKLPFVEGWMSPELAEKIVSGIIGSTGSNVLGSVTSLFSSGAGGALESLLRSSTEDLTAPFTVPQYDLTKAVWKRAVREMTARKNALLSDPKMKTLFNKLSQETDPEKREKLLAERRSRVQEYQQQVGEMVKRLEENYHGTFGAQEFAAVLQLLNFNSDAAYQSSSQYSSDLASDLRWEGRDEAIQTMRALGINGVHDNSIFGYLTRDKKTGEIVVRYNSPVAIMEMDVQWKNQSNYHLANIKALASENDLWNKKKEMDAQVKAIYNQDKLSSADYDKVDELYVEWNKEVMKALAPYIQAMTPEAAINNSQVKDYLDGLIEVPSYFKKDKYGKSVTNSKLGKGSATDAYMESYIKYIFGVNDTSYRSGKNYSDRQNYDEENKRWTK